MELTLEAIASLYATCAGGWYGEEPVSQLAHALQCAHHAENASAQAHLVGACLLHDLGHLLVLVGETTDERHQEIAAAALSPLFSDALVEPVRLHVAAKRYLCAIDCSYYEGLSEASKRSLAVQGGTYCADEADRFISRAFAADAVRLRRWDDESKAPGRPTPPLEHFLPVLERCLR